MINILFFLTLVIGWITCVVNSDGECHMECCDKCMWKTTCPDRK